MRVATCFVCLFLFLNQLFAQDTLVKERVRYNGLVNVTPAGYNKFTGGIVNISNGSRMGLQNGIVNYTQKDFSGLQLAAINYIGGGGGVQVGFVNILRDTLTKPQVGLLNIANTNGRIQIGIINYSDTIQGGSAWSFLTIVRRGGYYALEYYISEMMPINMSFKLGLSKRHNAIHFSSDPTFQRMFIGHSRKNKR